MKIADLNKIVADVNKSFPKNPNPSMSGRFKKNKDISDGLDKVLDGKANPRVEVHAKLDRGRLEGGDEQDVVITIGINYGQLLTYGGPPSNMRPGLKALNKLFLPSPIIPMDYHLIAWNLFPIITKNPWADMKLNGLEEALAIWRLGYDLKDWTDKCVQLCAATQPVAVVFHGVDNAVPYYGFPLADLIRPSPAREYPRVVFSGNLSRASSVTSARTTVEIRPLIDQGTTYAVVDE